MSISENSSQDQIHRRTFLKYGLSGALAIGGMSAAYASYSAWQRSNARDRQPTIILITLDTTRADHLSCYGYHLPTSPNIDRLAAEAIVYENAIASATWTLPSHASLFTGKFTASHGVCKSGDGSLDLAVPDYGPNAINHYRARPLAAEEQTLATLLEASGYQTSAVVAGPWLKDVFGLSRGFETYDDENIATVNGRLAEDVTNRALQLMSNETAQPRFLFLNYFDAHYPYDPPAEFARQFASEIVPVSTGGSSHEIERMVAMYDAEISYMDFHLGRLFDGLRGRQLFDDAWIIVTADHGELLGEHSSFGHPGLVYQESVHVPMIVKPPQGHPGARRESGWIQLVDLFPLMLNAAHIEPPVGIQGSLPSEIDHPIVIESRTLPGINEGGDWFAIIEDGWKFAWNSEGRHLLFNLGADPNEQYNLFLQYPMRARAMGDALHAYLASLPQPGPATPARIDKQTQATLKSLGYL